MIRRQLLSLAVLLAFVALLTTGPARAGVQVATPVAASPVASPLASPTTVELPTTPVGRQLAWVLSALNERSASLTEAEMTEHLAPAFLAAVPSAQAISAVQQIAAAYGPFSFAGFAEPPTDTEAVGTIVGRAGDAFAISIAVEPAPPHRIVELVIEPAAPTAGGTPVAVASWAEFDERFRALAPQINFLAAEIGDGECRPVHAVNSERRLAIGSTFKLYVLGELANQIEAGTAAWDEPLAIRDDLKSLPSGTMQDEPAGMTHPLGVYAEHMVSISDNTATDHLIHRLGRENVEVFQTTMGHGDPARNLPFLTTREMFVLKLALAPDQLDAYLAAPTVEKRRLLSEEVAASPLSLTDVADWLVPRQIDTLEWFASADDLCRVMTTLKGMSERPGLESIRDVLSLNPGMRFVPTAWTYVGFKGGSEPGVLNVTWLLERADGRWFVLTASLNDPDRPLDETAAIELLATVPALLAATQ